jgi:hypothetical protein
MTVERREPPRPQVSQPQPMAPVSPDYMRLKYAEVALLANEKFPQFEQDLDETKGAAMAACGMAAESRDNSRLALDKGTECLGRLDALDAKMDILLKAFAERALPGIPQAPRAPSFKRRDSPMPSPISIRPSDVELPTGQYRALRDDPALMRDVIAAKASEIVNARLPGEIEKALKAHAIQEKADSYETLTKGSKALGFGVVKNVLAGVLLAALLGVAAIVSCQLPARIPTPPSSTSPSK